MSHYTTRNHYKRYRKGALQKFEVGDSKPFLNELQRQILDQHLHENLYLAAKEIAHYVEKPGLSPAAEVA